MPLLWGIDLGGTKIEAIVLEDVSPGAVLARQRIATEAQQGYQHIVNRIRTLVSQVSEEVGQRPERIGIGTPGTIDPVTRKLKNSNTTSLIGQPFLADLQDALGVPVKMANDANCFVLAETLMGSVAESMPDVQTVFGVIMGTGVGGGIVANRKIWAGPQGIAGEWGHNFLDESGGPCYCGRTGCVERIISGPALERYYAQEGGEEGLRLPGIVEKYHEGDVIAQATLERLCYFFGKGISVVINILDPDVIIIGGGVGNIEMIYSEGVRQAARFVFNDRLDTVFLRPKLGDSAGVFGAALLHVE